MMTAPLEAESSWRISCGPEILVPTTAGNAGESACYIKSSGLQVSEPGGGFHPHLPLHQASVSSPVEWDGNGTGSRGHRGEP